MSQIIGRTDKEIDELNAAFTKFQTDGQCHPMTCCNHQTMTAAITATQYLAKCPKCGCKLTILDIIVDIITEKPKHVRRLGLGIPI